MTINFGRRLRTHSDIYTAGILKYIADHGGKSSHADGSTIMNVDELSDKDLEFLRDVAKGEAGPIRLIWEMGRSAGAYEGGA